MKTTVDISDELLARAKRHAVRTGRPLRAVIEDGLRLALEAGTQKKERFTLADRSVGDPAADDPLASYSWQELREEIYGGR